MKRVTLLMATIFVLTGCGNSTYDKAMENAKLALASGEFDEATALSNLALEEKPEDEEVLALTADLESLNEVKNAIDEGDWEEALKKIGATKNESGLPYSIAQELKRYEKSALESQQNELALSEKIKEIEVLLADQKNEEAKVLIVNLQNDDSLKTAAASHSAELDRLLSKTTAAIQEDTVEKEAAAAKATADAKEKEAAAAAEKSQSDSLKKQYLNKLAQIEISLTDLDYLYKDGVTSQMIEGEAETLRRWDVALNEIYGVLNNELSDEAMARLRDEQRDWILYRDYEANLAASEFEGGSFEEVQRLSTLAQLTKDRCYLLVDYLN